MKRGSPRALKIFCYTHLICTGTYNDRLDWQVSLVLAQCFVGRHHGADEGMQGASDSACGCPQKLSNFNGQDVRKISQRHSFYKGDSGGYGKFAVVLGVFQAQTCFAQLRTETLISLAAMLYTR